MKDEIINFRLPLLIAAAALVVFGSFVTPSDRSAALAQQRNQTDLAFVRERASLEAAERRITELRQRVGRLTSRVSVADSDQVSAEENVLSSRGGLPTSSTGASDIRARAAIPQSRTQRRGPQTLRNRDRAVTGRDIDLLNTQLNATAQSARSLGERVNRPEFGAGLTSLEQDLAQIEAEIAGFEESTGR